MLEFPWVAFGLDLATSMPVPLRCDICEGPRIIGSGGPIVDAKSGIVLGIVTSKVVDEQTGRHQLRCRDW